MNKLTVLLAALIALAMMTGPAMAAEMTGGEDSSVHMELRNQLSPNIYGYIADGVNDDVFRGPIDTHYGVAPEWEAMTEEPLGKELRRQLSPRVFGYIADGVSDDEFRGPIDTHYGVAPAWEVMTEEPLELELRRQLSPTVFDEYIAF